MLLASCLSAPLAHPASPGREAVADPSAGDAYRADVRLDRSGNGFAVFEQESGGAFRLYANRYTAERGWSGPVIIDAGTGNAYRGKVALDDKTGDAIAVFKQETGKGYGVYAGIYRAGKWERPVRIDSGSGNADGATVAYGPAGNAAAVFEEHDGKSYGIYANIYDPKKGWTGAVRVDQGSPDNAMFPAHAFDRLGNLHIAYYRVHENGLDLYTARRDVTDGTWRGPERISSVTPVAWKAKEHGASWRPALSLR